MLVLAIHSSSPSLGVAVVRDGLVLSEEILPPAREHLENIAHAVGRVMARLHMSLSDLDGLGVAIGPGSFSGIRVGLSFVKGLAIALNKPVAGISCLEILAEQTLREGECGAAIIDARRAEVYACVYRRESGRLVALDEPRLMAQADMVLYGAKFAEPLVLCGDPVVQTLGESMHPRLRGVIVDPSPAMCAMLAWNSLSEEPAGDFHALSPLYIRRSDAEEKKGKFPHDAIVLQQ